MISLLRRNVRYKEMGDSGRRLVPWVFMLEALIVAADSWAGGNMSMRLPLDLAVTLIPLMGLISSVWKGKVIERLAFAGLLLQVLLALYYCMVAVGILEALTVNATRALLITVSQTYPLMYFLSLCSRIRDLKAVMKSGTVWTSLCLAVESIYVVSAMFNVCFAVYSGMFASSCWMSLPAAVFLGLETFAIGIRLTSDSLFVLMHRHERRIVESLKVSHVEVSNDGTKDDSQYMDIYERVVAYFEKERPYLNSELTINDVVKVVFTNKLYISRAISQYTGRNFRQFVNYYRVTHSVSVFRDNPEMKVVELASACGFNSVVSFNMAFRLYMNENPSEWCRKERSRLIKGKNKLWNR